MKGLDTGVALGGELTITDNVSVLNYALHRAEQPTAPSIDGDDTDMKKWQCQFCGFEYDESLGLPDHGIPAGTRWEDVPADWCCPDCGASKSDFQMIEV